MAKQINFQRPYNNIQFDKSTLKLKEFAFEDLQGSWIMRVTEPFILYLC